mmetsp:Transcript_992/g.1779  ORF Transcript_992/g.1779 Transcript_992/m.1779 type:complete len:233 (-) Transcript_992:685-1383(-)
MNFLDRRVIFINQLMYCFHRQQVYVVESLSKESWYWGENTFKLRNPLKKYDYGDNTRTMLISEVTNRLIMFVKLLLTYGTISVINALFIRMSIKCSILMIFPMICIQNRFSQNQINHVQRRLIYQSMGDIGAMSAYFDRNGMSKTMIYLAYIMMMAVYYIMYMACYQVWTSLAFNQTFSDTLNDGYFFYVNTIELVGYLFIRTRTSIKYLPKFILVANLTFLMYCNSFMYPS